MKPKTRREIIKLWSSQSPELLDCFCCPNCRDLLFSYKKPKIGHEIDFVENDESMYCHNENCSNFNLAIKPKEEKTNVNT